jgi:ABC-type phosphate transport system substrate-binding protein
MKRLPMWRLGWLLLALCGCRAGVPPPATLPASPEAALLAIGLGSSAALIGALVAGPYAAAAPQASLTFIEGNETALFADLDSAALDALLVHVLPPGGDYWYNPVALDGLAIVVHPDNPLRALSSSQVQGLFSGATDNWAGAGGEDLGVIPVGRERGDGARALLTERIMAEQRPAIGTLVEPTNEALLETVAAEPGAIGYTMIGALDDRVAAVVIDGVEPTPNNAGSQNYPLSTPLYFVAAEEPQGELRAFLAWLQSPAGQAILSDKYGRVR